MASVRKDILTSAWPADVWAAIRDIGSVEGGQTTHFNASAQVIAEADGTSRVVWMADFLPDTAAGTIDAMMSAGAAVMKPTLDRLAAARDRQ